MPAVTYRFSLPEPHAAITEAQIAALRGQGLRAARGSGVILGRPVRLRVFVGWPFAPTCAPDSLWPTIKPLVDGIVTDGGLLTDDSDRCIRERVWRSDVTRAGCVELELTFEEIP